MSLNWYDHGARNYDPAIGRWMNIDPLAEKYPTNSPFIFCYNSPNIFIDPDGKEGIVVSGSPGDHDNKEHFLVNGLDRASAAKKRTKKKQEKVTWIIYNDPKGGYSNEQIKEYTKKAEKAGIILKIVSNADEIVEYVNKKDGGETRKNDKITSFYYVGHATPGDLDVGYQGSGEDFDPSEFNSNAFASSAHINLVGGCRTAIDGFFEDSVATQFAEKLDKTSTVYASDVRVYYNGGVMSDSKLVEKNKGTIVEKKGELPIKKTK